MRLFRYTALAAAVCLGAAPAAAQAPAPADDLQLNTVRFYRPDGSSQTMVKAIVEVPYGALLGPGSAPAGDLHYQVALRILDSAGLQLAQNAWAKRVPAEVASPRAHGMELAEFSVAPGRYRLEVVVKDSAGAERRKASHAFEGFRATPDASDLMLSPSIRLVDATDTVPRPGEMRRGNTMILPAAVLALTPNQTKAYYLLEAYNPTQQEQVGTMTVSVVDSSGKDVIKSAPAAINVLPGGGVLRGQLDLAGLPEGRYEMRVLATLGTRNIQRAAPFTMAGMAETMVAQQGGGAVGAGGIPRSMLSDSAYFSSMGETGLDSAFAPLSYIARSRELRPYDKNLSLQGRRNFFIQFWKQRDPNPSTQENEAREAFYGAIEYANKMYREPGKASISGWRTDRGRIFAKNGVADEMLDKPREGRAPPYQVWRYTRGNARYYVFADRTGLGNYSLIMTNDRTENTLPGWRDIVGQEAVREIDRYLNTNFLNEQ